MAHGGAALNADFEIANNAPRPKGEKRPADVMSNAVADLAEREADEARMRTERVMKQCDHRS